MKSQPRLEYGRTPGFVAGVATFVFDTLVLGGGAAGLMTAIEAGKRGRRVAVLDHSEKLGRKILVSGGGRCNFTNKGAKPENYVSQNPHFVKSVFSRYTPADFIALVERHRIRYHEKKLGQLFCDEKAPRILKMLMDECEAAKVRIVTQCRVGEITRPAEGGFKVVTNLGEFTSQTLVVATGGLSLPNIGATDIGYRIAEQFGIRLVPRRAGLVPFTMDGDWKSQWTALSGVSFDSEITCGEARFRENTLITHRGISGPAVLQVSSYWQPGTPIRVNLLPEESAKDWLQKESRSAQAGVNVFSQKFVRRFAETWLDPKLATKPMKQWTKADFETTAAKLSAWEIIPAGTEGYATAEVTLGGVDTRDLTQKTMDSTKVPGLFFVGEVVDVTGWLGGYNFQWAWASGYSAGRAC